MKLTSSIALAAALLFSPSAVPAQTLNLPPRPPDAPTGSQFVSIISTMTRTDRENHIYAQVMSGNVPNFQRALTPITATRTIGGVNHSITYHASPDYLAIGSDADYFLMPTSPLLAQRLCDALGCTLPTRKMVNQIWTNSAVKLTPHPFSPDDYDIMSIAVFDLSNDAIRTQRNAQTNAHPLGALVAGDKKDVIISTKIYTDFANAGITKPVVIYGWHYPSGSPIQPLYNGHEETYMDYSHGIRLVQNAVTVDGSPNTITNVLKTSSLAALLSDEGTAEGTSSDGLIALPRYTIAALAPVITTQPRTQATLPGGGPLLRVLVAGDPPLSYRWQFNGSFLSGATNATLLLSNAQPANVGTYTVVLTNRTGSVTSRPAILRVSTNIHPALFADNLSADSAANWSLFWGASNGVPDYSADWAFDHGATLYTFNGVTGVIPPAPGSADGITRAVRLSANNNDATASTAAVNLYPTGRYFSGNFAVKFDMWLNYPSLAGSTVFGIFGLNHLGTQVNWAAPTATSSDGVWFAVDGEGGVTTDYRAFVGNLSGTQTALTDTASSGLSAFDSTASIYQTLFPATRFEMPGAPGKNWVQVELRQTNNFLLWIMDGAVIAQRTNASAFTAGNAMIGYMDAYPSIPNAAQDAFVLFANLRVEDLTAPALQPPAITAQPAAQAVNSGQSATFTVGASGSPSLNYQWRRNGTNLPGATTASLTLTNVQTTNAGAYDALVSNAAGMAASVPATLTVNPAEVRFLSATILSNGQVQFLFAGVPGQDYLVQASTNLIAWMPIAVLTATNGPLPFVDPAAGSFRARFYRARQATTQLLTDFEAYAPGTQVMFQPPSASGSTSAYLDATPNFACVTNNFPAGHSGTRALAAGWSFKNGAVNPWLRLTTFSAANLPNPTIGTNQVLQFDLRTDKGLYVGIGFRETATTAVIGADGGVSGAVEFLGGTTDNTALPPKGRFVPAGAWTTLQYLLPFEPVFPLNGNGLLETSTGKGVLEHIEFVPASGPGIYNVWLDNIRVTDL